MEQLPCDPQPGSLTVQQLLRLRLPHTACQGCCQKAWQKREHGRTTSTSQAEGTCSLEVCLPALSLYCQ